MNKFDVSYVDNCDVDHPAMILLYIDEKKELEDIKLRICGAEFRAYGKSVDGAAHTCSLPYTHSNQHQHHVAVADYYVRALDYAAPYTVHVGNMEVGKFGDIDIEKCKHMEEISLLSLYGGEIKPGVNFIQVTPVSVPENPKGLLRVYAGLDVSYEKE